MKTNTAKSNINQEKPGFLNKAKTFGGKVDLLFEFLTIYTVYCFTDADITQPMDAVSKTKTKIKGIEILPGEPSFITNYLNTVWKYLEESLDKLINSDQGLYNVKKELIRCKEKCFREMEKYDFGDPGTFEAIHSWTIKKNNTIIPAIFVNLQFEEEHLQLIRDHCQVRYSYLRRLFVYIDTRLNSLINLPEIASSPYQWNSPHAMKEISELIYALQLSGRLKINKGNDSQFREQFFRLFGLQDKDFRKHTYELRNKRKKKHFLFELVKSVE